MKIWYDAFTGKHVRYGAAIAKRLRQLGHKVMLTTRRHPDTLGLAKIVGEKFTVVGNYDPASLYTRLRAGLKRMLQLSELMNGHLPDVALAHQSVDLCRVAFGLGIPLVLTADTAHATIVNKLTLPLAKTVIASEALPKNVLKSYGAQDVVFFKGVDEVAWIRGFEPSNGFDFKKPLIVVRQKETKASYALGKGDVTLKLAQKLSAYGTVVFLTRYDKQKSKGLVVLKGFVDSASLVAHADLVIGAGGTIGREAALQGVPSIVIPEFGRIHVNDYLSKKGFPIFTVERSKVLAVAKKHLGKKWDVKEELAKLENPVDIVENVVTSEASE